MVLGVGFIELKEFQAQVTGGGDATFYQLPGYRFFHIKNSFITLPRKLSLRSSESLEAELRSVSVFHNSM